MRNIEPGSPQTPLRVGILTDSLIKPQWVYKLITEINTSPAAKLVLVIRDEARVGASKSFIQSIWQDRQYWLYKAYSRLDNCIYQVETDAFKKTSLEPLLSTCSMISVEPIRKKFSDFYQTADVTLVHEYKLDVLLYLGRRILRGEMLQVAKYGVWSYHHGDNLVNRGGPPGFWEVMENHSVTGSILQVLTEDLDGGKVLYRSYAPTFKHSVKRNKNHCYWKSVAFVRRKLEELYNQGPQALENDPYNCIFQPYSQRLYKNPTNREFFPVLLKFGVRVTMDKLQKLLFPKQWFLAYQLKPDNGDIPPNLYQFKPILPPKDRFWADPFPVKKDDKYFIFIEEYLYKGKKGHISVIEMDQQGHYSQPVTVLEKGHHLSYPFIFQWQGDYYMIPETAKNRTVELYRCTSFPFDWRLETVLLEDVKAVDATLAEVNGLWWMFVNIGVEGAICNDDELHLFYAKTPLGPWRPHRRNPVKSDARSARPAGHLFSWRGGLYRPAQDCSERYGYAISLNKIRQITPDKFEETEVSKIWPSWSKNLVATHTLNSVSGLTVTDGMLRTTSFPLLRSKT